jgi:hypothetical protein
MYSCISARQFVGVVLVIIARQSVTPICEVRSTAAVPCGIMNTAGNKGGVTCSVSVLDTRIAFVAVHLAGAQLISKPEFLSNFLLQPAKATLTAAPPTSSLYSKARSCLVLLKRKTRVPLLLLPPTPLA